MFNIFTNKKSQSCPCAYIFIGRSGCGKGTQADLLIKKLKETYNSNVLHIETGALLRDFTKNTSYTAQMTREIVNTGGLMPESIVIGLWVNYLMNNYTGKENLVFDGAPRKLPEAILLDGALEFYRIFEYKVIYINVSEKWAKTKLMARGRKDDTEEGIKKRMDWFNKDVLPSIDFFKKCKSCEFLDINGEKTIKEVYDEIIKRIFK